MPHFLTTRQANALNECLDWYHRIGRRLRLRTPQPTRRPSGGHGVYWGKLDSALTSTCSTGVTVSVWTGNPLSDTTRNITGVLPPPVLASGDQLDSGEWVKIERIAGRWYPTNAACEST